MYKNKTTIQKQIEDKVIAGRDRKNTLRTPSNLRNSEVGVQIALANMEVTDNKYGIMECIRISPRLEKMIDNFKEANIPLEAITDANGFNKAFSSAYGHLKAVNDEKSLALIMKPIGENKPYLQEVAEVLIGMGETSKDLTELSMPYNK